MLALQLWNRVEASHEFPADLRHATRRHIALWTARDNLPGAYDLAIGTAVVAAGFLAGTIPAWRAYRNSLADGLSMKV